MNEKKWNENIPAGGVLCSVENDAYAVITHYKKGKNWIFPYRSSDSGYMQAKPITAAEWWDFAPWQDMKDAELMTLIIVINNDDVFTMTMLHDDSQRQAYKKWLPLPKEDK